MAVNSTRGAQRRCMARRIQHLSEDDAEKLLAEFRYGSFDEPVCPRCGSKNFHYRRKSRRQWRCRHAECGHTFSVTSGTRLDNHKLTFKQILELLVHVEAAPKGVTLHSTSNAVCLVEKCSDLRRLFVATQDVSPRVILAVSCHARRTCAGG
jgi:transposase-like protein